MMELMYPLSSLHLHILNKTTLKILICNACAQIRERGSKTFVLQRRSQEPGFLLGGGGATDYVRAHREARSPKSRSPLRPSAKPEVPYGRGP